VDHAPAPAHAGERESRREPEADPAGDPRLQLLAELETLLDRGDLVAVLEKIGDAGDRGRWLVEADSRTDRALRLLWLEYLLTNREQVLDLMEDFLHDAATAPEALPTDEEGFSLGSIQAFDDLLYALPRLSSAQRLARFRGLLEGLRGSRGDPSSRLAEWDADACLVAWDDFADAEQALARLGSNRLDPREYLVLLGRVPAESRRNLAPLPILRRMIVAGASWQDFAQAARLIPPSAVDIAALDDVLFENRPAMDYRGFGLYVGATGRARWPEGRAFIERCMAEAPGWRFPLLLSLNTHLPPPPAEYVLGLLDRYDLGERNEEVIRNGLHRR